MELVKTSGLKKYYRTGEVCVKALDHVNLSVEEGEFIAVVGPSGCGKTTLLNMLGGLDNPTEGTVLIHGKDITKMKSEELTVYRRKHIGFVFQNYNLLQTLNVKSNILLPLYLGNSKIDEAYFEEIVEILGIKNKLKNLPNTLSGGQQQRVSIARALALQPKVLFFDEPTSALDPELTGEVLRVIRQLADEHMTMVIVTHEMQFAKELSDRVIFMEKGLVCQEGTPEEVFGNPNARVKEFIGRVMQV